MFRPANETRKKSLLRSRPVFEDSVVPSSEPVVAKFMTTQPFLIEEEKTLQEAQKIMVEKEIRHLSVVSDGEVVGIISERDIKMAAGLIGSDPRKMIVRDVCHENVYEVSPDAKLHDVAKEMAEKHYGCAVVVQNNKLVGIFTTVDACRAIVDILQQRYHG